MIFDFQTWNELQASEAPTYRHLRTAECKAHKAHTCDSCGRSIERGEVYTLTAYLLDDEFQVHREHGRPCFELPRFERRLTRLDVKVTA